MNEYRCTRDYPYQGNCPGVTNVKARQGHYIVANNENEALAIMAERYPKDIQLGYWFTADLWKMETQVVALACSMVKILSGKYPRVDIG